MKEYYAADILKRTVGTTGEGFNLLTFNRQVDRRALEEFCLMPPLMCDQKAVYIKHSGLFKSAPEEEKRFFTALFDDLPDYLVMVFLEGEIDKRSVLYKRAAAVGAVKEYKYQQQADLKNWVLRILRSHEMKMADRDILYFLEHCDKGMHAIFQELMKLIYYKKDAGEILRADIDVCVCKRTERRVFDMIDAAAAGKMADAYAMLRDLKTLREQPAVILTLFASDYLKLRKVKLLSGKMRDADLAKQIGVPPFFIKSYLSKAGAFTLEKLDEMVFLCQETDLKIKSGQAEPWTLLEMLIAQSHF